VLWTTVAFLLAGSPYNYGDATIGLFGLVGVVGALAAQLAGRLADRGYQHRSTGGFFALTLLSWGLIAAGSTSLAPLVLGIALLDLGIQGAQITNQSLIYSLAPEARSRVTTAFMTAVFASAAITSAAASALWDAGGWDAVSVFGAGLAGAAVIVWLIESVLRARSRSRSVQTVGRGVLDRAA